MIAATILTLVCVLYRVALGLHGGDAWVNFAPVAAIALCGAIYWPRGIAWLMPLTILGLSDLILNRFYGAALLSWEMGVRYASLAAVIALAFRYREKLRNAPALLGSSVASSVWFYLVTNTACWIGEAAYAKTLVGWTQALTEGLPGFAPTWVFFRNSLVSDLVFTGLFVACISWSRSPAGAPTAFKTDLPTSLTH